MFPTAPDGAAPALVAQLDRGWQYLQMDDMRSAEREFAAALKQQAAFYPAEAALGYTALARKNPKDAGDHFDRALEGDAAYVPALLGRGEAMLELNRDADALASFESAIAADPSLTDLRGRVEVLRLRATQGTLARAKKAADAQRWDEARMAYEQAIAASPDSAFLYRELAGVEQKAGQTALALSHYRKAVEMDATDAHSHAAIGAILEGQEDLPGALESYERARAIDPNEVPEAVVSRLRARAALARLPAEYRAIPSATSVSRAEVAALVAIRLEALVARARPRQAIITDVRGHWAERWITPVVRAGIMNTLPNYQFGPGTRVRRGDLALVVSRVLSLIAADRPELATRWEGVRVQVADVGEGHLSYPAVSMAVASGVMPLNGAGFDLLKNVTGAEALEVMGRLEALAQQ
ncbi:MAG: tetratricopeptide repeat protein [Vicinamibacterales bacterium]